MCGCVGSKTDKRTPKMCSFSQDVSFFDSLCNKSFYFQDMLLQAPIKKWNGEDICTHEYESYSENQSVAACFRLQYNKVGVIHDSCFVLCTYEKDFRYNKIDFSYKSMKCNAMYIGDVDGRFLWGIYLDFQNDSTELIRYEENNSRLTQISIKVSREECCRLYEKAINNPVLSLSFLQDRFKLGIKTEITKYTYAPFYLNDSD